MQYTYISIQIHIYIHIYIYLFIYLFIYLLFLVRKKCKRPISIVFGTVHSDRTVVVLLCEHFSS